MSILDDAREISRNSLRTLTVTGMMVCVFCGRANCRPNCVRHSLPRIVAVLEAAQAVAQAYDQETAATGLHLLGSPLLKAVDALDKALES